MSELTSSHHKHHREHKVGGCSGTRYGCCPNSDVSKVDRHGSNCPHHHRDSRIHHIGYHPRRYYHPVDFVPIVRRPIVRQHIIVKEDDISTKSEPLEFNYINLIIALIIIMFIIFMAVRFFH